LVCCPNAKNRSRRYRRLRLPRPQSRQPARNDLSQPPDYDAFVALLVEAAARFPGVRILAYCLMPSHWHLVLWPSDDGELSAFMG
jgi:hypothetical protein